MGTKEQVLALLQQGQGAYLSGQQIAERLGISRTAVWKAAKSLQQQGLPVISRQGYGYALAEGSDLLREELLRPHLSPDIPVQLWDTVDSTNLAAKRWAADGAPHGALVVAERQSAGRGRRGRGFASPQGGVYLSMVLRPAAGQHTAGLVTSAAAVAVCRAVAQLCGIELDIKWVNDLYWRGKKCCGILTEAVSSLESGSIEYMVLGIGLNYTTSQAALDEHFPGVASSLYPDAAAPVPRAELIAGIHRQMMALFAQLDGRAFLQEYRRRSLVLGKEVTVLATPPYTATVLDIDDEAALVLATAQGRQTLSYGEVSIAL